MPLRRTIRRNCPPRAGLAPLELVLSLPLLLFVMALAINFGNAASWKVRAANVARDAVWSSRWPRSGTTPWPVGWPYSASRSTAAAGNVSVLYNASIDLPVVRGPMLGQTQVNRNLLDPTRGLQQGTSTIQQNLPLMQSLGNISYNLQDQLLDDGWQYQRMGMASNTQRREPIIYNLAQADPSLVQQYIQAVSAIYYAPFKPQLNPLDQDAEIYSVYGSYRDFHPRLGGFCSLNTQLVQQQYVQPLIDRIQGKKNPKVQGVPETMTRFFIGMYKYEKQLLQSQGNPALQSQIAQLDTYIGQLNAFLGQIQ
jgi:hypothetical protein